MVYTRNQPNPADDLDISQPFLTANTNASDDSFGVDHYKFSDSTGNNGFHNNVTTPIATGSVHPTTVASPKIYGMQDAAAIGLIQYSRGISDAVPTPLTTRQSPTAPITLATSATSNVIDFTGITSCVGMLYVEDLTGIAGVALVIWGLGSLKIVRITGTILGGTVSGNILQITNLGVPTLSNIFWTLQFLRITA